MRIAWIVGVVVLATWLWFFRTPLLRDEVCALRDSGNFYYPLFSWECGEWSSGRLPLWNPYDGLGIPAHADATSSVFYPLKVIFALPVPYYVRFNLYVAIHLLLAAGTLYFVARQWNLTEASAGVGALSYAFGGYVVTQHCNVVFLISAAWLPLAVWCAESMLVQRSYKLAMAFGAILALMVYGGDPQTAYHAGLLAVLYAIILRFCEHQDSSGRLGIWMWRPVLLTVAAAASFGLAAMQVLPAWEWTSHSERVMTDVPRSIYELGTYSNIRTESTTRTLPLARAAAQGMFGTPSPNTHARRAYMYSFGPWRLVEILWPNFSGRNYPFHRRWLSILPAEGKVWMPTIYFGLIPLIGVMTAWRWKGATARDRWLVASVIVGLVGSFGWFGLGWLVQELRVAMTGDSASPPWIGQQVGGLYWLLTSLLPGYAYFRFPVKWFVVAALGFSLLAARGVEQILNDDPRVRRIAYILGFSSIAALTALVIAREPLIAWMSSAAANDLYGPLSAGGAWLDAATGMLHVIIGCLLIRVMLAIRPNTSPRGRFVAISLLLLTAVDLAFANSWLVATVPHSVFEQRPTVAATTGTEPPTRIAHRDVIPLPPAEWKQQGNETRLSEIVAWEHRLLMYRHNLEDRVASLDAPMTVRSEEWTEFLRDARRTVSEDIPAFDWAGVDYLVSESGVFALQANRLPRASLVPPSAVSDRESASFPKPDPTLGSCRIVQYGPRRVEIEVDLKSPAMLVLTDSFDPNWRASIKSADSSAETDVTIQKIRGIARGVSLSTGKQQVVFTFRPISLMWGAAITVACVLAGLAVGFRKL